jgi:hypothetical protein
MMIDKVSSKADAWAWYGAAFDIVSRMAFQSRPVRVGLGRPTYKIEWIEVLRPFETRHARRGSLTPPKPPTARLQTAGRPFGRGRRLGRETGHNRPEP